MAFLTTKSTTKRLINNGIHQASGLSGQAAQPVPLA